MNPTTALGSLENSTGAYVPPMRKTVIQVKNGFVVMDGYVNGVEHYNTHVFKNATEVADHLRQVLVETPATGDR